MFDVYYMGRNDKVKELVPFAKQIDSEDTVQPKTKMYWLIEPNVEILDVDILKYRPPEYDQIFEHVWKWDANNYGGLKLVPTTNVQGTKQINHIVCKKSFEVINSSNPGSYFEDNPFASHVWCIDPEYVLDYDELVWAPNIFEPDFIHNFHLRGQLEHKYPLEEGGVKLYPANWKNCEVKYHGFLNNALTYPILYVDDPSDYSQRDTLEDSYVWLIDRKHKINEESIDWTPGPFEKGYIHNFKMPHQLRDQYPMSMGGVFLVPKDWKDCDLKIHKDCPVEDVNYDVFFTNNQFTAETFEYFAKRSLTEWFWVVDWDYEFNGKLLFVPEAHEEEYIHVFKWGMEHRYNASVTDLHDNRVAGIYLVNKNFDVTKKKLHLDICPVKYDIFYTEDINNFLVPSRKSRTDMFWLVDQDYILSNDFTYVPSAYDQQFIHIFKIDGQLEHKYDPEITNVGDNRAGGVKLIPKNTWKDAQKKFVTTDPLKRTTTRLFISQDVTDWSSVPEGVSAWIIDAEYQNIGDIIWTPTANEKNMVHVFHAPDKMLENPDKYEAGKSGGILYIPALTNEEREKAEIKYQTINPLSAGFANFDIFDNIEDGVVHSSTEWFWLVDPTVDLSKDFNFSYIPDVWDKDKIHVWQKVNPKTGRQYDYGGVKLVPKDIDLSKRSRPKYIKETASTQKEFPVLELDAHSSIIEQLTEFDNNLTNTHFWAIDPHVQLMPDFEFEYYPTQWDAENVHIFQDQKGNYRNVRLYPKGLFEQYPDLTEEQIDNNSFENVKLMNTVVSQVVSWPVIYLDNLTKDEVVNKIHEYGQAGFSYVWTVDPDVIVESDIVSKSYQPAVTAVDKVHLWQRVNPATGKVHSYGGLRLWPTARNFDAMTTQQFKFNKLKGIQYVREPGSTYKNFDIVFISYQDNFGKEKYEALAKRFPTIKWIEDVTGIFEAHKAAAELCDTDMFWVVDSDAEIMDSFDFSYIPDVYDQETTHVWKTLNPITEDSYGYGGVKLFNRQQILDATSWGLDFTTGLSSSFKLIDEISNISKFNDTSENTWRSAFREAAKLTLKTDNESQERLQKWLEPSNTTAEFYEFAKDGATQGNEYAKKYGNRPLRMSRINDFEWLKDYFLKNTRV